MVDYSFIHSFHKYLLSVHYGPGTIPVTVTITITSINKVPAFMEHVLSKWGLGGGIQNKQVKSSRKR